MNNLVHRVLSAGSLRWSLRFLLAITAGVVGVSMARAQGFPENLRNRLDLAGARVVPLASMTELGPGIDIDALLLALEAHESAIAEVFVDNAWEVTARVGRKNVRVDRNRGTVVVNDDRGYATDLSASLTQEELVARASTVLAAIGVQPNEGMIKLRSLSRRFASETPPYGSSTKERLAQKLFVERVVAGYPVRGDRVVVSFALDGTIRSITAHWTRVDYGKSELGSSLTPAGVQDHALRAIEGEAAHLHSIGGGTLDIAPDEAIRVHTILVPEAIGIAESPLRVMGVVEVPVSAKGGRNFRGVTFAL